MAGTQAARKKRVRIEPTILFIRFIGDVLFAQVVNII